MTNILMRNKANNTIARVPQVRKSRSIFPIGKSRKQTMKCSYLTPICCEEVLPSDTWIINLYNVTRLLTQLAPVMDNLYFKTFFFFVPNRLVWENFPKQHGERKNPNDTIDYITPKIKAPILNGFAAKSIYDYMGVPTKIPNIEISALPFRAYNLIWNEFFRSERLQESIFQYDGDADDDYTNYELKRIGKYHDYFTDCLPDLQLGEAVTLPLGTSAPVWGNETASNAIENALRLNPAASNNGEEAAPVGNGAYGLHGYRSDVSDVNTAVYQGAFTGGFRNGNGEWTNVISKGAAKTQNIETSGLYADLSNAVAATITAMRQAIDLQTILERDNRNGTRYTELLQTRYGALNPDLRLQRPQYLGGTSTPLFTNQVIQTSGSDITGSETPQGNLAGYGICNEKSNVIKQSFGEFGYIIGLAVATAIPQYQQGLHKKFTRFERFDYYYPEFAGLSDQAVLNQEIYAQSSETENKKVFGYIPRFDEYRNFNNEIAGELRSNYDESLDIWHYAEKFENAPQLNEDFIEDKTAEVVERTLAVQKEGEEIADQLITDCKFVGQVIRVLPSKAEPITGGRIL